MYTFLLCTYTSTVYALALTLALALSLLSHYHLTSSKIFSSGACALCPCCPGAVWLQRSCDGGAFCANLWISLDTTSTSRSLWKSLFLMYQGALTMFRSTLFWNRCMMSVLLCLVQPQIIYKWSWSILTFFCEWCIITHNNKPTKHTSDNLTHTSTDRYATTTNLLNTLQIISHTQVQTGMPQQQTY